MEKEEEEVEGSEEVEEEVRKGAEEDDEKTREDETKIELENVRVGIEEGDAMKRVRVARADRDNMMRKEDAEIKPIFQAGCARIMAMAMAMIDLCKLRDERHENSLTISTHLHIFE